MKTGGFTVLKRWVVGISALLVLAASVMLSKKGVGLGGDLEWAGFAVALALTASQFMFNSEFEDWTWTLLIVGGFAYLYSINTNIVGFYFYRGMTGDLLSNFDWTNFGGGIFMDVYPELALAWVFRESKVGDFLGNLVKAVTSPETLTQRPKQHSQQNQPRREVPNSIPRKERDIVNFEPEKEENIPDFLRHPRPAPRTNGKHHYSK